MRTYYETKVKRLELILAAFDKEASVKVKNVTLAEKPYGEISALIKELDETRELITDALTFAQDALTVEIAKAEAANKEAE